MSTDPLPVRRRRAARVLVFDGDGALLLLHDSDPGAPGVPSWWITPGGGIEEDDDDATRAAARELQEETGLRVDYGQFTGPVWQRRVTHRFSDHLAVQDETFFVVTTGRFTPSTGGFTASEKASITGHRWWSLAELRLTTDDVWPRELAALLAPILLAAPHVPAAGQLELPEAFENPGGGP